MNQLLIAGILFSTSVSAKCDNCSEDLSNLLQGIAIFLISAMTCIFCGYFCWQYKTKDNCVTMYHTVIRNHPMFTQPQIQDRYKEILNNSDHSGNDLKGLVIEMDCLVIQSIKEGNTWVIVDMHTSQDEMNGEQDVTFKSYKIQTFDRNSKVFGNSI